MSPGTSRRGLVLLAPYGARLWSQILPALERIAEVVVVEPGDDTDLALAAGRVLRDAPARFHVAGFCLGGHVAMEICRQAPERVSGLAMLNACLDPDSPTQHRVREERIAKLRTKALEMDLPDEAYVHHAAQWLVSPGACCDDLLMTRVRELLAEIPLSRSLAQQQLMLSRQDNRSCLPAVAAPVLVVGADYDRLCPPDRLEETRRCAPRARLGILADCGHLSPLEKPAELGALLTEWLAEGGGASDLSRLLEQTA